MIWEWFGVVFGGFWIVLNGFSYYTMMFFQTDGFGSPGHFHAMINGYFLKFSPFTCAYFGWFTCDFWWLNIVVVAIVFYSHKDATIIL